MVFNATFNNISVISWGTEFYWWRKPVYPEETIDLPQVTDKLYHINVVPSTPHLSGIQITTLVVIGNDCIGS